MAKYKQNISTELLYTMACFHDPAIFFEYFNSKERTKDNKPYEILQPFIDYSFSRLLSRYRCVSGSRNVSKTTLIENETLQDLLTKPDQKTGFVIPSEKHMLEVADNMVKKVERYPILETIFKNWSVKNRVMEFHTGHLLEFRIMGTDTTGEKTGVALHCLDENEPIVFYDGSTMTVKEVVENKIDKPVLSYNLQYKKLEACKIIDWYEFPVCDEMYQIELENGKIITCTEEHSFYNVYRYSGNQKFIKAKHLTLSDKLLENITFKSKTLEWWGDKKYRNEFIRGCLLGDGSLDRRNGLKNARFSFCHSEKQKEYLELKSKMIDDWGYSKYSNLTEYKSYVTRVQSHARPELNDIYNELIINNKKIVTLEYLKKLTPLSIAVWYMDDGSISNEVIYLSTHGFSKKENKIISKWFKDTYNIETTVLCDERPSRKRKLYYLKINDKTKFLHLISKYVPECMKYKLNSLEHIKIKSIRKINYNKKVYDIEVEKNHNYFVNGLLCHNTGKILIDEAQLVAKEYLQQLTPGAMKGFEYLITGVSNNLRTTALWYGVSDPMFVYIRYAMYEGPNWDEDMEKMMLEQTGGKNTEGWKTLVEGRWGDRAYNVFPNNKIWEAMRTFELHKFSFIKQTYHDLDFESIKLRLTLPAKDKKFIYFILGVDVGGNSQNSPSEFTVWGCYMNGEKKAYAIVYKLALFNIGTVIQAEVFDYLAQYFSFYSVGIDAQAVGSDLYRNITEGKILPQDRTDIYKSICKPFIMTATIVVDEIYNKQKEKFEDLKMPVKIKATTLVQDLFRENMIEIPNDSELIEAFQAETWQSNRQRIGGITYMNDKNEHFVDSTRMAILSVWQTEKDGEKKQEEEKISREIPGPNIRRLK